MFVLGPFNLFENIDFWTKQILILENNSIQITFKCLLGKFTAPDKTCRDYTMINL